MDHRTCSKPAKMTVRWYWLARIADSLPVLFILHSDWREERLLQSPHRGQHSLLTLAGREMSIGEEERGGAWERLSSRENNEKSTPAYGITMPSGLLVDHQRLICMLNSGGVRPSIRRSWINASATRHYRPIGVVRNIGRHLHRWNLT